VNAKGGLAVTPRDPRTGTQAKIDSGGRQRVSDGGGTLTMDGATRPLAPARPWSTTKIFTTANELLIGPTSETVNVTSPTVASYDIRGSVALYYGHLSGTATDCGAITFDRYLWDLILPADVPFAVSFPPPLQIRPASGTRVCLWANGQDG
jgi:hypothetical protein